VEGKERGEERREVAAEDERVGDEGEVEGGGGKTYFGAERTKDY
jgi:hypothetical protein